MSDIRKLIDILNETTVAGAVGGGPAVPLGATHKRMEEEQTNETAMPEVIEYGNWENSALVTEKKTKSMRPKSKRIVKSVYGVDNTSAEGGEASESKEPQDKKKKVRESARSVAEDQVNEEDLIVNPAAIKKAMGIIARDKVRTDHEVEMARSDLLATIKNAQSLYAMLKDRSEEQGLEGWVQEKLIKANDYLNAVKEYYDEKMMQEAGVIAGGGVGEDLAEGLDPVKKRRLYDLIELFRDATDPSDYYDRDIEEPEEVIAMIRNEFGSKIADQVSSGAYKMHFPRHKIQRSDPLGWKKPVDRLTKAGKMYKQDSDYMKNTIKSRYKLSGKSATEGVAEGEGLGYSRDPNQAKWYHEGRNAHKGGTAGSSIQDIAKKHGCPAEWLDAFRAGYQDQAEWSKQGVAEGKCPECGGPAFSEQSIAEAKDACYHKVKSRVKVWPSAYASGQLVQCRKRGAKNWGTGKK